jgi:anion-transporting  ArsA/GET3 family ATPase
MIVLVGSEKGGVGKSTIAAHTAVRLAMTGKPTILIDRIKAIEDKDELKNRALSWAKKSAKSL